MFFYPSTVHPLVLTSWHPTFPVHLAQMTTARTLYSIQNTFPDIHIRWPGRLRLRGFQFSRCSFGRWISIYWLWYLWFVHSGVVGAAVDVVFVWLLLSAISINIENRVTSLCI